MIANILNTIFYHHKKLTERSPDWHKKRRYLANASEMAGYIKHAFPKELIIEKLGEDFYNNLKSENTYGGLFGKWCTIKYNTQSKLRVSDVEHGLAMELYMEWKLKQKFPMLKFKKGTHVQNAKLGLGATADGFVKAIEPFEFENVDGEVETYHGNGVVEMKTIRLNTSNPEAINAKTHGGIKVPAKHYVQMQTQMKACESVGVNFGIMVSCQMLSTFDEFRRGEITMYNIIAHLLKGMPKELDKFFNHFERFFEDEMLVCFEIQRPHQGMFELIEQACDKVKELHKLQKPPEVYTENFSNQDTEHWYKHFNLAYPNIKQHFEEHAGTIPKSEYKTFVKATELATQIKSLEKEQAELLKHIKKTMFKYKCMQHDTGQSKVMVNLSTKSQNVLIKLI